jgi:perosamine synthetase
VALIDTIPRRCVNLPRGTLRTLADCVSSGMVGEGPSIEEFHKRFSQWLGVPHVFGVSTGRSAFQLALEALALERGKEIIFPAFTFPVIPMVAKLLGYKPVFCDVDPGTFNACPEHIEAKITDKTGAVVATHLFGQPCSIKEITDLCGRRNIRVLEDCAHACGATVNGQRVGTFGDIGIFSFAEGKNMPCFGGGAIVTSDETIALRAKSIFSEAPMPTKGTILRKAFSVWTKWLLTQPSIFGLTVYPILRLRLLLCQPLMDSAVGDEFLGEFSRLSPRVTRLANLQAAIGILQLERIDAFNEGARRNARILTDALEGVPRIKTPRPINGDHIYVYYPLMVEKKERDDLRRYLLRCGVDSKLTDMSDCSVLKAFRDTDSIVGQHRVSNEDCILEICVYPIIRERSIRNLAKRIQEWAQG